MRILISAFNMYKGGSKTILDSIQGILDEKNDLVQIVNSNVFSVVSWNKYLVKYPIRRLNWLYRIMLEALLVPAIAYKSNCTKIVMLGNFPSLFWFKRQSVFFHNTLYLETEYIGFKCLFERCFFLFSIWLKMPELLVQTTHIEKLVRQKFGSKIKVRVVGVPEVKTPLFNISELCRNDFAFFYPAHYYPHKNHSIILNNCNSTTTPGCSILLTVDRNEIDCVNDVSEIIKCIGAISHCQAINTLENSNALLFVSSTESLGLPLVEAVALKKPIVAPNLTYVNAVVKNYYKYEVEDPASLLSAMNQVISDTKEGRAKIPLSDVVMTNNSFVDVLLDD